MATETETTEGFTYRLKSGEQVFIKKWDLTVPRTDVATNEVGDFDEIPQVDVSGIYSPDKEVRLKTALEIKDVLHRVGFMYAINHGVDEKLYEKTFDYAKKYFDQSMEKKLELHNSQSGRQMCGYFPPFRNNREGRSKPDTNEAYCSQAEFSNDETRDWDKRINVWPSEEDMPGFKEHMIAHNKALRDFAYAMIQNFALGLGLPENYFEKDCSNPKCHFRQLHYKPQPNAVDSVGTGAHEDLEILTLLKQDEVPALQVLNTRGEFVQATPIPGSIVVNVGDQLQRITNGYFRSTVHRVVNVAAKDRYSAPFFYSFNPETMLEVLPVCCGPDNPPKYEPISALEFVEKHF